MGCLWNVGGCWGLVMGEHAEVRSGQSWYLDCRWWAWAPLMVGGGVRERSLARDVDGKLWSHLINIGDAVPCCSFLNSLGGEEMGEEVDGIDPLRFTISHQEFFIDGDVTFGVDACSRLA